MALKIRLFYKVIISANKFISSMIINVKTFDEKIKFESWKIHKKNKGDVNYIHIGRNSWMCVTN